MAENQTIQNVLTNTFEIGTNFADIGGEDIDLKSLNLTDTLLGTAMTELTQALGEAENNAYENYHLGDSGISDIELTMFDSAILRDSGIKAFNEDPNADNGSDEVLSEVLKMPKKEEKSESAADIVHDVLRQLVIEDTAIANLLEDDRMPWSGGFQDMYDENGEYVGNENDCETIEFTDKDFDDRDTYDNEMDAVSDYAYENPNEFYGLVDNIKKINPFWY